MVRRASLDGRKISFPSGYFLVHQYLLPYNSYIPVHTLFNLPSTAGQSRSFVLSVTTSQFYHLPPLPTLRHLKLFCHCRYTLRSLLLVIPVYLMLHGHLNSPQTLVMEDVLTSPTCPNLCRRGGGGGSVLSIVSPDSCLPFPTSSSPDSSSTAPCV